jgi:hypothetical protein
MAQPMGSPYGSRRRLALALLYTSRGSFLPYRWVRRAGIPEQTPVLRTFSS